MFRQASSLTLIVLLTILVGVKDLALGFCVCEKTLFLGKDPCSESDAEASCCSDCEAVEEPCDDDCSVPIQLEISDYLWSSDAHVAQGQGTEVAKIAKAAFSRQEEHSLVVRSLPFPSQKRPPPSGRQLSIAQRRLLL